MMRAVPDPRRRGRAALLRECPCGRVAVLTGEEYARLRRERLPLCPDDCGKGAE